MTRVSARARQSANYRWWALGAVLAGFFSTTVTITLLTAVLPTIADELHVGPSTIAWVVTGPMLVTGVLTPAFGKAGDLYGHKRVYLAGWVAYGLCALGAALAWNATALIAFRLAGAAAGAATGPASQAIILHAFAPHERVKAMGWHSFVSAGAPVLGLVIGGPLVDLLGWRWVFGIQVPFAIPAFLAVSLIVRPDDERRSAPFDLRGAALFGLSISALLFALNRAGTGAWASPRVTGALVTAVVLAALFVRIELRHPSPVMPFAYFRDRDIVASTASVFLGSAPYMGVFFIGPFVMHDLLGYDNTRVASALVFRPLAYSVAAALAGYVAIRAGERATGVGGSVLLAIGIGLMVPIGPSTPFAFVALGLAVAGLGHGVSGPPLSSRFANAVRPEDFGTMSAVQAMLRTVGTTIGMQGLQTFVALRAPSAGRATAYHEAFALATVVAALAVGTSAALRRQSRGTRMPVVPAQRP